MCGKILWVAPFQLANSSQVIKFYTAYIYDLYILILFSHSGFILIMRCCRILLKEKDWVCLVTTWPSHRRITKLLLQYIFWYGVGWEKSLYIQYKFSSVGNSWDIELKPQKSYTIFYHSRSFITWPQMHSIDVNKYHTPTYKITLLISECVIMKCLNNYG